MKDHKSQHGYRTYIGLVPRTTHLADYQRNKEAITKKMKQLCGWQRVKVCDIYTTNFYVMLVIQLPHKVKYHDFVKILENGTRKELMNLVPDMLRSDEPFWYDHHMFCFTNAGRIDDWFKQQTDAYAESRRERHGQGECGNALPAIS